MKAGIPAKAGKLTSLSKTLDPHQVHCRAITKQTDFIQETRFKQDLEISGKDTSSSSEISRSTLP